jgi:hypothetical protein
MESTDILQEEYDGTISMEEEVYEEENKEAIVPFKLGDLLESPKDDSNNQIQNSIAIHEAPYTFYKGIRNYDNPYYFDAPLMASNDTSETIDEKECCLNMLYDTALDDGPMLVENPPCLHEDRNDILVIHDDALIHESPFLMKNPIPAMMCLKMIFVTTLKEESMLMNPLINLMILFVCQIFQVA